MKKNNNNKNSWIGDTFFFLEKKEEIIPIEICVVFVKKCGCNKNVICNEAERS